MHTAFASTATATAAAHPVRWMQGLLQAFAPHLTAAMPHATPQGVPSPRALGRGQTLVIENPLGQGLVCTEGALWITHDNNPADHVVERGGRHVAAGSSRMLVHAMSDAKLEFFAA